MTIFVGKQLTSIRTKSKQLATAPLVPCRVVYVVYFLHTKKQRIARFTKNIRSYTRYSYYDNKTTARRIKKKHWIYNSHRNNMLITYMLEIFKLISSTCSRSLRYSCTIYLNGRSFLLLFMRRNMFGLYVKACYPRSTYHRNSKIPGTQN